jgi:hypothetical protein
MLRIDLGGVRSERFELALALGGARQTVSITGVEGLAGTFEYGGAGSQNAAGWGLRGFSVDRATVNAAELGFTGGALRLGAPLEVVALKVEANHSAKQGLRGSATLAAAKLHAVECNLGAPGEQAGIQLKVGELHAEHLECEVADLAPLLRVGQASLLDVELTTPNATLRIKRVHVEGFRVRFAGGVALEVGAARAVLSGVSVTALGSVCQLEHVELPAGFSVAGGRLEFDVLTLDQLSLELEAGLARLLRPRAQPSARRSMPRVPDLPFLEHVQGYASCDLSLDVAVPVIKQRSAKYALRLDVAAGVINFQELEQGLSWLEDALVDFEVKGDRLILELDPLPLVTFDNQTLVSWRLDPADRALAQSKRVRLRKLLDYELEPRVAGVADRALNSRSGNAANSLRRLDLRNLDVALSIGGPSELALPGLLSARLGGHGKPAVGQLRLAGALHYAENQVERGELALELRMLELEALALEQSGVSVCAGRLSVGALEIPHLGFEGFAPKRGQLALRDVELRGFAASVPLRWLGA